MLVRVSASAVEDIAEILEWSEEHFGVEAKRRYRSLINQALKDVAADPQATPSLAGEPLGEGVLIWHLRNSRDHVHGPRVGRPRHFLIYRVTDNRIVIGRVLHDRMDLIRHVAPPDFD